MRYLLDTNVLSDVAQGVFQDKPSVLERLQHTAQIDLAVSSLTVYEINNGLMNLQRSRIPTEQREFLRSATLRILGICRVLPLTSADAVKAAELQNYCQSVGKQLGGIDACIAGQAVNNSLILVSHDRNAFSQIPPSLLQWEDWWDKS